MKINKLIIPFIFIILAVSSEYLPELFKGISFRYQVPDNAGYVFDTTYRDAVWYFIYSLLVEFSIIVVFFRISKENKAGKLIMLAPVCWFLIELYEKFCWLVKLNDNRLYINDGSKWQIFLALFLTFSGIYGIVKYKS